MVILPKYKGTKTVLVYLQPYTGNHVVVELRDEPVGQLWMDYLRERGGMFIRQHTEVNDAFHDLIRRTAEGLRNSRPETIDDLLSMI